MYDELLEEYENKCRQLAEIKKEINHANYFGICKSPERLFYNLIADIAKILEIDEDDEEFWNGFIE